MVVKATEFKTRVGKFLELVDTEEIIITRNGKEVAMLVPMKKSGSTPNTNYLYGLLSDCENKEVSAKQLREERINEKYGNSD